jgi:hypothetical protein
MELELFHSGVTPIDIIKPKILNYMALYSSSSSWTFCQTHILQITFLLNFPWRKTLQSGNYTNCASICSNRNPILEFEPSFQQFPSSRILPQLFSLRYFVKHLTRNYNFFIYKLTSGPYNPSVVTNSYDTIL